MKTLTVELGERRYPIHIGSGLLAQSDLLTRYSDSRQVMIVTNTTVAPLYLERVQRAFAGRQVASVILPDGEAYKTMDTAMTVFGALLQRQYGRNALVVALGCWSHLVTACVPACHALWLLWRAARGGAAQRRDAGGGLLALGVAGLLVLAMYALVLPDMASIRREFLAADGNEPTLWSPEGLLMLWMLGGTWTWWASAARPAPTAT